jgi:hypothetical protein
MMNLTEYWTGSQVGISVNGSSFTTASRYSLATVTYDSTFKIGQTGSAWYIDSDILWTATGTGTLGNSDATTLNGLGNTDPTLAKLYSLNAGAGNPTFVWNANTANYQDTTSSNGQALIYAANTSGAITGNLIDLQSGLYPSSKFSVDVNGNLTSVGKALFQNSSDSTTAFQIQNAAGTSNLFIADTQNSRIGIGTATPTATLSVNGSGLIQQSASTGTILTVSGNEITDATRTTNTQGDGKTPPDSSYGIWEGTTNLVTNGGFESNTTGVYVYAGGTFARDTTKAKFGSASILVSTSGSGSADGVNINGGTVTNGAVYTASAWILGAAGTSLRFVLADSTYASIGTTTFTTTGVWQRVFVTATANANTPFNIEIVRNGTGSAYNWNVDGVQLEQKATATPYVETNGATASRTAAEVQAPSSLVNATQGWVAMRVRFSFPGGDTAQHRLFSWRNIDSSGGLEVYYDPSAGGKLFIADVVNSSIKASVSVAYDNSHAAGETHTVIGRWDGTMLRISLDGAAFVASVGTRTIPVITMPTFEIGRYQPSATLWSDSDFLWFSSGTGTLTNSDASSINGFGNTDPSLSSFAGTAGSTMVWQANTASYLNSSSQPIVFQVQNSIGSSLLNIDAGVSKLTAGTSALFQNATNSASAFQVQNVAGGTILGVDTTNGLVNIGTTGTGGVNGQVVFNSTNAGGYGVTIAATSALSQSYTLNLPAVAPTQGQCLQIDSVDATQLTFGSCGTGGGGGGTLQDAYNNSSSPAAITTTSPSKTIVLKAGVSNDSTSLFQIQSSSSVPVLDVDTTNARIGIGLNNPTAALSLASGTTAAGGIAFGTDTNLYRSAASTLKTDGNLTVGTNLIVNGTVLAKNTSDSVTALQIQNSAGTSNLLVADTINTKIGLGETPSAGGATLQVSGNIDATGQFTVNGTQISSANLSNDANLAKLNGTGPQTFTGNNEFTGTVTLQNAADSTSAVQIQNATGTSNLFKADTLDTRIGIAAAAPAYTLDVGGDINTSAVYRVNGSQISTASLSDASNIGLLNANNIFSGNNTLTGTVLAENTANSTTAFQIQGSTGNILLVADTTNMRVYIGNPAGDSVGSILVLSNKTTAGDPSGTNGAMYYNASLNKFRCFENGAWGNCLYGAQTVVKSAPQTLSSTFYADINDIGFAVGTSKSYVLQCSLLVSVSGNGGNISMNGPASPSSYTATFLKASDQSAGDQFTTSNIYDDPNSSGAFLISTSTTGSNKFILSYQAILVNGTNAGTWQLRAKAASGGTLTFYPASTCDMRPF